MPLTRWIVLAAAFTVAVVGAAAAQAPEGAGPIDPVDLALDPDGKRILFTSRETGPEGELRQRVWLLDPEGRQILRRLGALLGTSDPPEKTPPRPLTSLDGYPGKPAFTPDGLTVSFVAVRGAQARPQVWVLPLIGGEAEEWTEAPEGVRQYAWAPDGSLLYLAGGDLWRIRPGDAAAERIHEDGGNIAEFALSFDGSRLAIASNREKGPDLWRLDLEDGRVTPLTSRPGAERSPRWSRDGKLLYFRAPADTTRDRSPYGVWSVPAEGGEWELVSENLDGNVVELATCPKSDRIYLIAETGPDALLYRIRPVGNRVEQLTLGPGRARHLTMKRDGEKAAFAWGEPPEREIATWTFPDVYIEFRTELNAPPPLDTPDGDGETK